MTIAATLRRICWLLAGLSLGQVVPLAIVLAIRWTHPPPRVTIPTLDPRLVAQLAELALLWPLVLLGAAVVFGFGFTGLALVLDRARPEGSVAWGGRHLLLQQAKSYPG